MNNLYSLTPSQTKQAIQVALQANLPILVQGVAGSGKSDIIKQVAKENNLEVIDIRLGQLTRFDLLGYPDLHKGNTVDFKPLSVFPTENTPLPAGKDGWLLFVDELLQADKYVQGAAYKIVLDRKVGEHNLHPNVRIVAAANGVLNSTADNKMVAPLKSRFIHVDMTADTAEFKLYAEDKVANGQWNPIVLGFINFCPEHISNYDHRTINEVQTFSCPRTIEFLSKQINAGLLQLPQEVYEPVIIGTIGESAGNAFNNYLAFYNSLPSIQDILNDPDNCPMPESVGAQWALISLFLQHINASVTNQFARYIERVPNDDIKVVIYRSLLRKCPQITQEPLVQQSMGLLKMKLKQITP